MKNVKLLLPLLLVALMLLVPVQAFAADKPIQLFLNDKKLSPEVPPRIVNGGTTLVPVRIVSEAMGAEVTWIDSERKVKIVQEDTTILMKIDAPVVTVNGKSVTLEAAPVIEEGNTLVPIRFIAEQLGLKVGWDQLTQSVLLFKVAQESESTGSGQTSGDKSGSSGGGKNEGSGQKPGENTSGSGTSKPPAVDPSLAILSKLETAGDQIVFQTSSDVTPSSFILSNPFRIVIDLPNAALGAFGDPAAPGQVGEKTVEHPFVDKIRYALYSSSPSTVRIVLDMKQNSDYILAENKSSRQWSISFTPKKFKVVIDAGHGGKDPGAKSINSRHEKDFTLPVANKVFALLQKEPAIRTIMTRTDDTYPTLQDRVDLANNENADLFVSIHGNSYKPTISGTETYYNRPESAAFAALMHRKLVDAAGLPDRSVRVADYKVIRETTMPAVLLEVGYLSNANDEPLLYSDEFQDKVAAAIAAGIKAQLQLVSVSKSDAKQAPADGKTAVKAAGSNVAKTADGQPTDTKTADTKTATTDGAKAGTSAAK